MRCVRMTCFLAGMMMLASCEKSVQPVENESSPARSPEEELATFQVEEGFKIQLVASEPMVQDPIVLKFDEDGRLWVVEMRGFMTDMEGSEEELPLGRISVLEDEDGNGEMDKSTIYLDSLVMPRALGLIKGGALVAENNALWITRDLDGDLKADTKELLDSTYSQNGIPEHSDNGLLRAMDNWYYSAKSKLRYRQVNGEWLRDSTEARGQWGISQDDEGRLYYNYNWSQLHSDLVPANYLSRNVNHSPSTGIDHGLTIDRKIFPIRSNPAVNRGYIPGTLDEQGKLLEFTAACSPLVFRSSLFPEEYYQNVFVCEPSGNLIKRNVVKEEGAILMAHDPNPGKEFLASTDERFRPTHTAIGPDGAIYIADMYRGLIQHGSYVTPYLKEQTIDRGLVLPVHLGRVWRIVPEDWSPKKSPKMSSMSSEELISLLSHDNGFQRDMAQRLLVEKNDLQLVSPLRELAKNGESELGRLHAIWTLEGMGVVDTVLLFDLLDSKNTRLINAALRILENEVKKSPQLRKRLENHMIRAAIKATEKEALQLALSSYSLSPEASIRVVMPTFERYGEKALIRDAIMSSMENREFELLQAFWKDENWIESDQTQEIFLETLTSAIISKGDSQEVADLLAMMDSDDLTWKERVVLTGMAIQGQAPSKANRIALTSAPALLQRVDLPVDENRVLSIKNLFSWPGYTPSQSVASESLLDENSRKQFALGRQKYLTTCAGCHGSDGMGATRMGPPLANSDWVLGDETRLSLIILHGMEGPLEVSGKTYDAPDILPVMPAHSTMDDRSIAAILTYIRNEWGNHAPPISGRTVSFTRHRSQGRVYPWSAPELNQHMEKLAETPPE